MDQLSLNQLSVADRKRLLERAQAARLQPKPAEDSSIPPMEPGVRAPLSFAQQRLWFLTQLEGTKEAYHIPTGLRLKGDLDAEALRRALDRILVRHEALRTTFAEADGEAVPCIAPAEASRFALIEADLRTCPDAEGELERQIAEEARAPFNLRRGPLVRGRLLRVAEDEHALLITFHHIVSDGWSMGVLVDELSELYRAYREGKEDPLPPLKVQYKDYAAWQRAWMSGEVLQRQADFWKGELAGIPELLDLPTDHRRPAHQDFAGAFVEWGLDAELTGRIKALSQRHGTTLYMTLLTAWGILLGRLSGQEDLVLGTPMANRSRTEIEGLIGFFVNTLALRLDLSGSPTVGELLNRVKVRALEAQHHQDIPFEQVVEIARPVRSLAHSPVFQVMFAWQNTPEGSLELPGLRLVPLTAARHATSKFDLTLVLREADQTISGGVEYATSLFEGATIERYLGYLRTVLEGMVADDAQRVDRLALMTEGERRQVLVEWNATEASYPKEACIHELFEAQVEASPEAVALVQGGRELSYGALNEEANRLAHRLRELGVGPDARVAICAERGFEMVVALLAVLKAGGAYVPLDPAYPAERLRYMVEDAGPVALLTQRDLAGNFEGLGGSLPILDLGSDAGLWADRPATNPGRAAVGLKPEHLAYVIYTSGSTGTPKGVMIEHRSLGNLVHWHCAAFELSRGQRASSVAGVGFDAAVWETWPPLCTGAALVLPSAEEAQNPEALLGWWGNQKLDVSFLPTPMAEAAFAVGTNNRSLRTLLVGGDRLRRLPSPWSTFALVNNYGPTEGTVVATSGRMGDDPGALHIGRPISNVRVYILDAQGHPVPMGVRGEIHIGGAGVARGYLNRPELTAERFLEDPFAGMTGARMYKTGDLGKWRPDGTIEFLGRNDFQVKVRGFRIELGEIESRLLEHPEIREATVLAREDAEGEKRLVAYYIAADGGLVGADSLRAHLAGGLPEYMVPTAYVPVEGWPLTPNGKLDRKALPEPEGEAFASGAYEAPLGEIEETLASIWADVLKVERVGRHDNFFDLGGHSLLALQSIVRLREALGMEVKVDDVFAHPVLSEFASGLESVRRTELPPITPTGQHERIPLSFAQQRLWFLSHLEGVSKAYHVPYGIHLKGTLDPTALGRALERIVARHETLRTTFTIIDGEPVQRIAPVEEDRLQLVEHDLRQALDPAEELRRLITQEARAPFDLERGPLIRGRLIRQTEDEYTLLVTMHHIVADGWSMGVLAKELTALYRAYLKGKGDPLPPLRVHYKDYAAWQRKWIAGEVLQRQADFWKTTLAGVPEMLNLPTDHVRPAQQDYTGAYAACILDEELTRGLKALSKRHGTTLYMTLLAAWGALLSRLAGQEDLVIGTPVANRGRTEIEGLIGFFVNTLPLRLDFSGSPTVGELLARVKAQALEAQHHQDIPFEQVVEIARPVRSLAHSPLFQVMFVWQNAPGGTLELPGLELSPLAAAPHITSKYDLTLALGEQGGAIVGGLEFATSLFEPSTIQRHFEQFKTLLRAMVADDARVADRLPLLTEEERGRILEDWNGTRMELPKEGCIHELFETQAALRPEAVALQHEERELSYGELNERANRLAHHLRGLGVGPDTRVAICAERGFEMVVGLLAVLKAGGAYVPLDPAYPIERLRHMLEDSAPVVLLTQGELAERFGDQEGRLRVLDLKSERPEWADRPGTNPERTSVGLGPEHLAYVIYTSGSTGMPKGVAIEHRNAVNFIAWGRREFPPEVLEGMLFSTSLNFDLAVFELYVPLSAGGKVRIVRDAMDLVQASVEVTLINTVPSAMSTLVEAGAVPGTTRAVNLAGEPLKRTLVERIFATTKAEAVSNLYGPSETTTYSTWVTMRRNEGFVQTIGRPVANTRVYILDAHGQPVPVGVTGEIHIGGAGVARGYLNRPELTAERFVEDPLAGLPGARMYRTGDLGRWRPDGMIEFLGRNDFQVKVRGFRIELGEIETRLLEHPSVREAVVVAREDGPGDKRLVGYVATGSRPDVGEGELKAWLASCLPDFMVPGRMFVMEQLPHTPNGKIDQKALPEVEKRLASRTPDASQRTALEETLTSIWKQILGRDDIWPDDNFFDLGGHSMSAIQLKTLLKQELDRDLPIVDIFTYPTIRTLAHHLEEERDHRADMDRIAGRAEQARRYLGQRRLAAAGR